MICQVLFLLGAASVCLSRPDVPRESDVVSARQTPDERTPNQVLDEIASVTVEKIKEVNWDTLKSISSGYSMFPLQVNIPAIPRREKFSISEAIITGLGSLHRSKTASFNAMQTVLSGTLVVENVCSTANYSIDFRGVGAAPSQDIDGVVKECLDKLFADVQIGVIGFVPQNILSYTVRCGHDGLDTMTNLDDSGMAPIHSAGARKALLEVMVKTMETNVKVKINQAIQDIRAEATK